MAELDEKQREFLDNPFVGVVTTLRKDGSPHSTVVWVDREDDGTLSFNTARGRAKERHLLENPNLALMVVDPANSYRWVAVSGRGELTEDGADPQIDRLAKKYLDQDEYPFRDPAETRVKVVIKPEHVEATGLEA